MIEEKIFVNVSKSFNLYMFVYLVCIISFYLGTINSYFCELSTTETVNAKDITQYMVGNFSFEGTPLPFVFL